MTVEANGGSDAYRPGNTPGVFRKRGPEASPRTSIFGNGVPTRVFAGVTEEWYFDTTTRTYKPVADRTNGSK